MKTIYANISPLTNAYTNFYHLFILKQQNAKVFLCVWDLFFFEDRRFLPQGQVLREEQLKENVYNLEKVMQYLKIDYKLVYLSEVWNRYMSRPDLAKLFQKILSTITYADLQKKAKFNYSLFHEATLSRMNYLIIDFLVATHFHELFPELAQSMPQTYITSEQFRVFHDHITATLSENYRKTRTPDVQFVTNLPVIVDNKQRIPGIDMSKKLVNEILDDYYENNDPIEKFYEDFNNLFNSVSLKLEHNTKDGFYPVFYDYLLKLRDITKKGVSKEIKKSLFITSGTMFGEKVKPLNDIKLKIMQLCDGSRTSYEIAKQLKIKPVTVSVYFGRLKEMGLISDSRKPKLLVSNIVIDINSIKS